jgi:hypothetical protein
LYIGTALSSAAVSLGRFSASKKIKLFEPVDQEKQDMREMFHEFSSPFRVN